MTPIKTIHTRVPGLVGHIYHDPDPESPAEWDNLGEITYNKAARTVLGTHPRSADEDGEIARLVRDGKAIGIPVWAYVHSGATIKATYDNPFGCPWDSGRSGWVWVPVDKVLKEYSRKAMSKKLREQVLEILRGEVETFDQYLRGDVYGYVIEHDGKKLDSCWGMYGLDDTVSDVNALLKSAAHDIAPMEQKELPIEFAGEKS